MAIIQISRIQHRRGLQQDLPNLASAELGWSLDSQKLYIGNGTLAEGAPIEGRTEILTEHSDILALFDRYRFQGLPAGFIANTSGDAEGFRRSLQEKLDDEVNVRDFGAKGDGQTDDTEAITRAINNAYAYSSTVGGIDMHRTVKFPAGYYLVSGQIKVPPFIKILGDGKQNTILRSLQPTNTIFVLSDSNGVSGSNMGTQPGTIQPLAKEYIFEDIGLHNDTSTDNHCLVIDGGSEIRCNRVAFIGANQVSSDLGSGKSAVYLSGESTLISTKRIFFTECEFAEHNYAVETAGAVDGLTFQSCTFRDLYKEVSVTDETTGVTMRSCVSENVASTAQSISYTDRRGTISTTVGMKSSMANGSGLVAGMMSVADYKNLSVDYTIVVGDNYRRGRLTASGGSSYQYQDEYVESDDLGVEITVNESTGLVYYSSEDDAEISFVADYHL